MSRLGRLSKGREFDEVYREGVAFSGPLLVLRCLRAEPGELVPVKPAQWGFAVGKKIAKLSVDRNRARRRLRECAGRFDVPPGTKLIVTLRPAGVDAPFGSLVSNLERLLDRAQVRVSASAR